MFGTAQAPDSSFAERKFRYLDETEKQECVLGGKREREREREREEKTKEKGRESEREIKIFHMILLPKN
jgi:hypothetical protein